MMMDAILKRKLRLKLFLFDSCKVANGITILMFFLCVLQLSTLNFLLVETFVVFLQFASYFHDACHCDGHCHCHYHYYCDTHLS